jgi:hypothetical protein
MANYWLGIMAVAFAAAMALWITLVFMADRAAPHRQQREAGPHREVMGGAFDALEGGRQVMPDPGVPLVPEARRPEAETGRSETGTPAAHGSVTPGSGQHGASLADRHPRAARAGVHRWSRDAMMTSGTITG